MDCRVRPGNDGVDMAEESAKLRIPYLAAAQAQKHVTHNEAMTLLDTLVQLSVLDKDPTAPPGSPSEGDCYIVAGGGGTATGAWIGWETRVARFIDGEWRSYLPGEGGGAGWLAWVRDEDAMYRFDGTDWTLAGIEGPQGPQGPAYQPDAAVDAIAGRAAYDGEDAAFSVLVVSDSGNGGQPTLYFKLSAASADWSAGITWLPETSGPAFTVRAATTSAVSIATGLNGGDTLDGVTLSAGELVLVKDQAAPEENGVYVAGASPARAAALSAYDQHAGALVTVQEGTVNADTRWQCVSAKGGTLGATAVVFAPAGRAGQVASNANLGKNAIINGGFDVWQENTAFPGASAGTSKHVCDGFYCVSAGAAVTSIARSTSVRGGARSRYCAAVTGAASVTTVNFGQAVEAIEMPRLKRTVTFSCWIYNNTGAAFTPLLYGYTPTAENNYGSTNAVINGASLQGCADGEWTKVMWTGDMSGYTGIDNGLALEVQVPSGSLAAGDTVRFAEWQLEEGQILDPVFEAEAIAATLAKCSRRYRTSYAPGTAPGTATSSTLAVSKRATSTITRLTVVQMFWGIPMRAVPSVALYNPADGNTSNPVHGTSSGELPATVYSNNYAGFTVDINNSAPALNEVLSVHYVADARLKR